MQQGLEVSGLLPKKTVRPGTQSAENRWLQGGIQAGEDSCSKRVGAGEKASFVFMK